MFVDFKLTSLVTIPVTNRQDRYGTHAVWHFRQWWQGSEKWTLRMLVVGNWVIVRLLLWRRIQILVEAAGLYSMRSGVFHPGEMVETTSTSALNPTRPHAVSSPRETRPAGWNMSAWQVGGTQGLLLDIGREEPLRTENIIRTFKIARHQVTAI